MLAAVQCYGTGSKRVCIETQECDPLDPGCVPTTIKPGTSALSRSFKQMIHSLTHSRKNLGLVLDASFEDPLRPIHAGSGLGNCAGCARTSLGFAAPSSAALGLGLLAGIGAGVFLWKRRGKRRRR